MDGHEPEELSDEMLVREIEAAFGVDPSPEFLPRVRARLANERAHDGWIRSASWRCAGAVVVVAVAGLAVWSVRDPVPALRDGHITNTPRAETVRQAPVPVASSAETFQPVGAPVVTTVRSARPAVARAEVVVSPDEAVALRQLVGAIAARRVEAVDIPTLGAESAPLPPIEEIVLEPIELSPMAELGSE
jgi:hypothetical protein